jgi:hypothetical protein
LRTLRITETTQQILQELSQLTGLSMQAVLDHAIEAYKCTVFLEKLGADFEAHRTNASLLEEELQERALFDLSITDGPLENERAAEG